VQVPEVSLVRKRNNNISDNIREIALEMLIVLERIGD
jgi:hypothetical protein